MATPQESNMTVAIPNETAAATQEGAEKKVFIQRISDNVMKFYEMIPTMENRSNDTRLSIVKSTRVLPVALTLSLEEYAELCQCPKLKLDVNKVIHSVNNMFDGGDTRLFVHHASQDLNSELEFICVALNMYKIDGEKACDFCMSTYSYSKSVDNRLAQFGNLINNPSVAFGALTLTPTSLPVRTALVAISAVLGIIAEKANKSAYDTEIPKHLKEIIEASFMY